MNALKAHTFVNFSFLGERRKYAVHNFQTIAQRYTRSSDLKCRHLTFVAMIKLPASQPVCC